MDCVAIDQHEFYGGLFTLFLGNLGWLLHLISTMWNSANGGQMGKRCGICTPNATGTNLGNLEGSNLNNSDASFHTAQGPRDSYSSNASRMSDALGATRQWVETRV